MQVNAWSFMPVVLFCVHILLPIEISLIHLIDKLFFLLCEFIRFAQKIILIEST